MSGQEGAASCAGCGGTGWSLRCERCAAAAVPAERMFPMQGGPRIPWWLAEVIYAGYSAVEGTNQSLERMAERGGFGWAEVEFYWTGIGPSKRIGSTARDAMAAALANRKPNDEVAWLLRQMRNRDLATIRDIGKTYPNEKEAGS